MKRSLLLNVAALLVALPCSPVRAQAPDTVRFGDLVRIESPTLRPQTGRFLEADSVTVVVALTRRGSQAMIGRPDLLRLELPRGRDLGRGFRRGALIGGGIGAGVATALVTLVALSCGECTDDDPAMILLGLSATFVAVPAAVGGLLGLAAPPPRWQPAVLAPPSPPSDLPAPDLGRLPVRVFARTQATADSLGRAGERQRAAGAPGPDVAIAVDEGHTGPAEVAYFNPGDAAEAATLAFWLGRVLHQSPPATRLQQSRDVPRRIVAWLDR